MGIRFKKQILLSSTVPHRSSSMKFSVLKSSLGEHHPMHYSQHLLAARLTHFVKLRILSPIVVITSAQAPTYLTGFIISSLLTGARSPPKLMSHFQFDMLTSLFCMEREDLNTS